jgi:hypothetical protein
MVPPALLSGDAPQTPARNRKKIKTVAFGASPQGIWKRKNGMKEARKMGRCGRMSSPLKLGNKLSHSAVDLGDHVSH